MVKTYRARTDSLHRLIGVMNDADRLRTVLFNDMARNLQPAYARSDRFAQLASDVAAASARERTAVRIELETWADEGPDIVHIVE